MLLQNFFHHANWLAVIVAALAYFILGSLWYSALFGKQWVAGHGIIMPSPEERKEMMKKDMPKLMITTLIMGIVMAFVIGLFCMALGSVNCMAGIKLGLALSVVGIIPMLMSHMYLKKPMSVWVIDGAYHLIGITVMSIIISVWH